MFFVFRTLHRGRAGAYGCDCTAAELLAADVTALLPSYWLRM